MRLLVVLGLVLCLVAPAAPVAAHEGHDEKVDILNYEFQPDDDLVVSVGRTVTWTWRADTHGVASDASGEAEFTSHPDCPPACGNTGDTFTLTFPRAGRYTYHCAVHPIMRGSIVVVAEQTPPPSPTAGPTTPTGTPTSRPSRSASATPSTSTSGTPSASPSAGASGDATPSPSGSSAPGGVEVSGEASGGPGPPAVLLAGLAVVLALSVDAAVAWARTLRGQGHY